MSSSPGQFKPKIVTAFMYLPKRNFYLLNLEIKNRVGNLAVISKALADSRIGILNGSFSVGLGGVANWLIFVQPEDQGMSGDSIKHLLLSLPDVVSCRIKQSKDGLLVDELSFPIVTTSGERAMILRNDIFNGMLRATREKFGSGADVILFDQGESAGKVSGKELIAAMGKEKINELLAQLIGMYQSLGWGMAQLLVMNLSPFRLVIRMYESAECTGQKSAKPVGHFLRGHMVGVTEEVAGIEAYCAETSCVATGAKYCEFSLEQRR